MVSDIDGSRCIFNALPRLGMALVSRNKVKVIKRSEIQEDVFSRDKIPYRLKNL